MTWHNRRRKLCAMGTNHRKPVTPRERADLRAEISALRRERFHLTHRTYVDAANDRATKWRELCEATLQRLSEAGAELESLRRWLAQRIEHIQNPPFDPYAGSGKYKGD